MWKNLTDEQKQLILQMQADEKRKAAAKAKKANTQKLLDKQDKHAFNAVLENMLEDIMRKHGIERIPGEAKEDKHIESVPVAELRKRSRILREQVQDMMKRGENPLDAIKSKTLPLVGTYYTEKDVMGIVEQLRKENAVLRSKIQTDEQIDKKNAIILQEQRKRQQVKLDKERLALIKTKKKADSAMTDILSLQEKLRDTDAQQKYELMVEEVKKERKALNEKIADAEKILRDARRDEIAIRNKATKDAEQIVSDARDAVDGIYAEYASSSVARKQKETIKLQLLREQYPDIDDELDSKAGHEVLKGKRGKVRKENVLNR